MIKKAQIFCLSALMLIAGCSCIKAAEIKESRFESILKFSCGEKSDQLLWLFADNGGVFDGPFQGPMAFITDKNGNFWIGDTLKARVAAFDNRGTLRKEIDLIEIAKKMKLASDPVLLDLIPGANGKMLVADAANNAVIELDVRGGASAVFRSQKSGSGFWNQINRIHCDRKGRIYVEDIPAMRTVVLEKDGIAQKEALEGEVGIAVNSEGQTAMIVMDTSNPMIRHVVMAPKPGEPPEKIAGFQAKEPILWAALIGFDQKDRLYAIFDTETIRHYVVFAADGNIIRHQVVDFPDPGYDPCRPDWIGPDGSIYTVKIEAERLHILKLN